MRAILNYLYSQYSLMPAFKGLDMIKQPLHSVDGEDVILLGSPSGGLFFNSCSMDFHVLTGVISFLAFVVFSIPRFTRRRPFTIRVNDIEAGFICHGLSHEILL